MNLLLGLAVLFRKRWAISLTRIWLWLTLALSIIPAVRAAVVSGTAWALRYHMVRTVSSDLVIFIALLSLIHLSRMRNLIQAKPVGEIGMRFANADNMGSVPRAWRGPATVIY